MKEKVRRKKIKVMLTKTFVVYMNMYKVFKLCKL